MKVRIESEVKIFGINICSYIKEQLILFYISFTFRVFPDF